VFAAVFALKRGTGEFEDASKAGVQGAKPFMKFLLGKQ
jgi:hypothetical protein